MKKYVPLVIVFLAFAKAETLRAQNDIEVVLEDLLVYLDGYIEPAAEASVTQAGAAWYYSAKALPKFKTSIGLHANALVAPEKKQFFTVNNNQFNNLRIRGGTEAKIPTALGPEQRTFFDFTVEGEEYELQVFEGISSEVLGHPFLQANVGLWAETELLVRFAPKITLDKSNFSLYGLGLKHNLSQYFFGSNRDFELAVLANYSLFDFNLIFDPYTIESNQGTALTTIDGALIDSHAVIVQLIASKDYNNWTFSSGVGYTNSWIDYRLTGSEGTFLNLFNEVLVALGETKQSYRFDLGATYNWNKWSVTSQLSVAHYANLSLGGVYKIN